VKDLVRRAWLIKAPKSLAVKGDLPTG